MRRATLMRFAVNLSWSSLGGLWVMTGRWLAAGELGFVDPLDMFLAFACGAVVAWLLEPREEEAHGPDSL